MNNNLMPYPVEKGKVVFPCGRLLQSKILATHPLAYWPLWEASGGTANDLSGNGFNGSYNNCTLNQSGVGDGRTATNFNGTTSYVDPWSASLASAFNLDLGTALVWLKVSGVEVWTDGTQDTFLRLDNSGGPSISLYKSTVNNRLTFARAKSGNSSNAILNSVQFTDWFNVVFAWSVGTPVKCYVNGNNVASNGVNCATFGVSISQNKTAIGCRYIPCDYPWSGKLAHVALWNRVLTEDEIRKVSKVWA